MSICFTRNIEFWLQNAIISKIALKDKHKNREVGDLGENIAVSYIQRQGFSIIDRNYWEKCGEIDIVAENKGRIHFIEVKSVQVEGLSIRGVVDCGGYRPEENVHPKKLERMRRVIQTYIFDKRIEDREWQFDVITVQIDVKSRKARVRVLGDLVL